MPEGFARYGLKDNPYKRSLLDPLKYEAHASLLVRVDGFVQLDEVDRWIAQCVGESSPIFVLVTGEKGAGRTSVARYLLARYRHHRGIPRDRFIVPIPGRLDHDHVTAYQRWLAEIASEIEFGGLGVAASLLEAFKTLSERLEEATLEVKCRAVLRRLQREQTQDGQPPGGFALYLEDVLSSQVVRSAFEILQEIPTIAVFTTVDNRERHEDLIDWFGDRVAENTMRCRIIELSALSPDDVQTFVKECWSRATTTPSPFDESGLRSAFKDRPRGNSPGAAGSKSAVRWRVRSRRHVPCAASGRSTSSNSSVTSTSDIECGLPQCSLSRSR